VTDWVEEAAGRAEELKRAGRWRELRDFDACGPRGDLAGIGPVVSFASNDYLGLSAHPAVVAAAHEALERWGAGAGAARLIVGARPVHSELEAEIAAWKATERALLFPNGFTTNLGVLAAIADQETLICSDELNHASIVDGCRMARARVEVYPHCDVDALDRLLSSAPRAVVVTDTVFSMDGDLAPVDELAGLCRRHGALLVLDEAHAVLQSQPALDDVQALRIGTLSKFIGAFGGFVAGPSTLIELLINRSRSFIFTTAASPADAAASLAALRIVRSREGDELKARLRTHIERVAPGHPSPIVPVVLGDERAAQRASAELLERGLFVPAIRPPSVPPGTARLRVTLSAAHTQAETDLLVGALEELTKAPVNA
jgi:8-amino-7-oxononanoate synthase